MLDHCDPTREIGAAWGMKERLRNRIPSERTLAIRYKDLLDRVISDVFERLPMSQATRSALRRALLLHYVRADESDVAFSGLVVAGFGQDDYYMSVGGTTMAEGAW
jgi:hypothetical protein